MLLSRPYFLLKWARWTVSYIRHKVRKNKIYAYEVTSKWDKELKRSKSISKYLGPVDPITKEIMSFTKKERGKEKLILDFGDAYFINQFILDSDIYKILKKDFFDIFPELIPLMIYRICTQSAMYNCEEWISGNILKVLYKNTRLSSQRISDLFGVLGDESVQRTFFKEHIKLLGGNNKSVIIDATSLPNQINIDFNAWGRSDGKIEKQFRFLCVVDQVTKVPLFYRFLPGNLTDVSTLQTTILELKEMGVQNSFILMDAGYFSESNACDLFNRNIDFLTRMPAGRKIYNELILEKSPGIEALSNANMIGTRSYFAKSFEITLYGNKAYVFIILDPERKAKETKELLQKYCNDKSDRDDKRDKLEFLSCGIMILVGSKDIPVSDVLSAYYMRQSIEQVFGFSKSDLGLLPIRNHNENTVRGYLFFQFIILIFYIMIREKFLENYTVEQLILILRKLKCKVYDTQIIPAECTRKQREIFEQTKILVPTFLGI
jgi:transposase